MKTLLIISAIVFLTATASGGQVAVIANSAVQTDTLDRSQLRDYYTGDIRFWENGEPVVLLDLKPRGETKRSFYDYIGKSPSRIKSIWLKRKLSGEGNAPDALESEAEIVARVAATPGALGFVSPGQVTDSVKTLLVFTVETPPPGPR